MGKANKGGFNGKCKEFRVSQRLPNNEIFWQAYQGFSWCPAMCNTVHTDFMQVYME